ncbi:MAG: hypothetical protein UT84_C0039G0004 [Candidatus Curtissbacteria bacterium GW2011_GWA1_40_16]|uniref:DUF1648 domain-containing protein n=1 Tax=Candidatus Curtissbacteria bacterium GW2011_GWA1_40_16 TaxID=1618405 RepID=A0A0G0R6I7_9BACT|nr:MAG: hypothetical protein UT84_C0039G0004 [Candidatus Curtissbacteria bacterium GW2011_GWA1_40_16]
MAYIKIGAYPLVSRDLQEQIPRRLALRREAQSKLSSDKFFLWSFIICIFSVILGVALILVSFPKLPPQLPLFYLHPWGDLRLASPAQLWLLPATSAGFTLVNFAIALTFSGESKFLPRVLVAASLVIAISALYDTLKIISLIV